MCRLVKRAVVFALSAGIAIGFALNAAGAAIKLKANDVAGQSSFVTNATDGVHGWSNNLEPQPDLEYEVNRYLYTPASGDAVWGGGRLTLNGGNIYTPTKSPEKVDFGNDFVFKSGAICTTSGWSAYYPDLYGTTTVTCTTLEGARIGLYINTGAKPRHHLTLKGAANACIGWYPCMNVKTYTGGTNSTSRANYFRNYYGNVFPCYCGDASEFYGTNVIRSLVNMTLASPHEFGGTLYFYPASLATFDASLASYTFRGAIAGHDGHLDVPAGVAVSAQALNFEFAARDSVIAAYQYTPSGGSLTTVSEYVYSAAPSTDEYVPSNKIYRASAKKYAYVNTVTLGAGAAIFADSAALKGTLLQLGADAAVNLNSLVADGLMIETGGGTLTVSNSFDLVGQIRLSSTLGECRTPVLRCPRTARELVKGDFRAVEGGAIGNLRIEVEIETDGDGMQTVYVVDHCPAVFDATTGYATLKYGESSVGPQDPLKVPYIGYYSDRKAFSTNTLTLTQSRGISPSWSDGSAPNSSTNYYANDWIGSCTETFAGKSLTFGPKTLMRYYANFTYIPDWRALGGSVLACDINQDNGGLYFGGSVKIFSTVDNPVMIAGARIYYAELDLYGDELSALALDNYVNVDKKPLAVHFLGDNSGFYGTFQVKSSSTALFKSSAANATVELNGTNVAVGVESQATAPVKVAKLRYVDGNGVTVDANKEFDVGALDIVGNGDDKTLVKSGAGLFAVGGTATAATGAALSVAAGALRIDSADALEGVALSMAAGTSLAVKYDPADAVLVADGPEVASLTAAGTVSVGVDFGGQEPPASASIKLITVPQADVAALEGKLVAAPTGINGFGSQLVKGDPVDGKVTYSLHVFWRGLKIILR